MLARPSVESDSRWQLAGPVFVALCFVASRCWAFWLGVRFDTAQYAEYWHFADPELLEHDLLQTLWNLHAQPPLFNAGLGFALKFLGAAFDQVWWVLFLLCGAAMATCLYRLCIGMGISWQLSALGTGLWIASPPVLLFENLRFYTYPTVTLLLGCVASAHSAIATGSRVSTVLVFVCAGLLVMIRSIFHPLWLLLLLAGFWWVFRERPAQRRAVLWSAAVPLLLAGAIVTKNAVLFGSPSMSSWLGMNLSRVVISRLDPELRKRWIRDESLSWLSFPGPFKELSEYTDYLPALESTGVAVLDRPKKGNDAINFHHLAYVEIARRLGQDSITVIRRIPSLYVGSVIENLFQSMLPAASYKSLEKPRALLAPLEAPFTRLLHFQLESGIKIGVLLVLFPILCGVSIWRCVRETQLDRRVTFILITFNIVWVVGLGALLERSQNQRFRFLVDPLLLVIFLWALQGLVTGFRRRLGFEVKGFEVKGFEVKGFEVKGFEVKGFE